MDPKRLVFDQVEHKYYLDGKPIPGVTTILRQAGLFSYYGSDGGAAMDRGTNIHLVTELHDLGTLDAENIPNPLVKPLDCWKKFREDTGVEILETEQPVYNEAFFYAGTLDRLVRLNGKEAIIDIKSGVPAPWHATQLSAYGHCFDRPLRRFCLYLSNDSYKLIEHKNDAEDWVVFRSCINLANWKKKVGAFKSTTPD